MLSHFQDGQARPTIPTQGGGGTRSGTLNGNILITDNTFYNWTTLTLELLVAEGGDDTITVNEGYFLVHEVVE